MEEDLSPRERIKRHVVEVAAEAFRTEGIRAVTMDDIARRLGMSKRTLYQIFKDKEDLLLATLELRIEDEHRLLDSLLVKTDNVMEIILQIFVNRMERFGDATLSFLPDLRKYPRILEANNRRISSERKDGIAFMKRGIEQGIFRPDVDFSIVFPLILKQVDFLMDEPQFKQRRLKDLFFNSAMVMIRGCATAKGLAMIDDFCAHWQQQHAGE